MLIKIIRGTYGLPVEDGRLILAKNEKSDPFELDDERAANLIEIGVAEEVKEGTAKIKENDTRDKAPTEENEAPDEDADGTEADDADDLSKKSAKELRSIAKGLGITASATTSKAKLIELISGAGAVPTEDPEDD